MLKVAFTQGMLAKAELDARLGQTFAARTYGELDALTVDLPAGLADAAPPQRAAQADARPPMSNSVIKAGICVLIAVAVAVVLSVLTDGAALALVARFYFLALLVAAAQIVATRHEKRDRRGQLPPRPAARPGARG